MHKVMHWVHRLSGSTMSVASVTYELKKMYITLPHLVYTAPPACGPGLLAPLTTTVQSPFTAGAKTDTKSKQAARVVNILPFVRSTVLSLCENILHWWSECYGRTYLYTSQSYIRIQFIYVLHILHVFRTADSVLIREVSFIHSVLYGVTGVLIYILHNLNNIIH